MNAPAVQILSVVYRKVRFFGPIKVRKPTVCWHCDRPLGVGEQAYRPLDNGMNRMRRLCVTSVEGAVAAGADHLLQRVKQ